MLINQNRKFSYPVLSSFSGHYNKNTSLLDAQLKCTENGDYYSIQCCCKEPGCKDITNLISHSRCIYALHIESNLTMFRRLYLSSSTVFDEIKIKKSDIGGKAEFSISIIATEDILEYTSKDFSEDLSGLKFLIEKGSFIAVGPQYSKDFKKLSERMSGAKDSIISIHRSEKSDVPIQVDLDSNEEKIRVYMSKDLFSSYKRIINNGDEAKCVLNQMFGLPVIMEIVSLLMTIDHEQLEMFKDKLWYKTIHDRLKNTQYEELYNNQLTPDLSILEISQFILKNNTFDSYCALERLLSIDSDGGDE